MRDLDAVRAALGYAQVNLYGGSYGTRVAQHYARRFPERTRAVMLDGVVPPTLVLGPSIAIESQRALDRMFARCARRRRLQRTLPGDPAQFARLDARLAPDRSPVTLADPRHRREPARGRDARAPR